MSTKRILSNTIDTNQEYEVVGLDLAKNCVSAALITIEGELIGIDRLEYQDLRKCAQEMPATTFAMEPCCEMNLLVNELESWGHRCVVIDGKNVQNYIETHFSNQKTDLNDAQALAFLARDKQIRLIKPKDRQQLEFACLTTLREQYVKQYRQTLVSLKGICQSWGLNISKGISGKARLSEMIEKYEKFPEELRRELQNMVKHAQEVQKALTEINKTLKQVSKGDELCKMVQTVPGIGLVCACRLKATIGDISRFKHPKNFPAYFGLVPRSISTGHNEKKGRLTKRGDKTMRSLMIQAAGSVILMANKGNLKARALSKWILKKQREKMPWGKLTCAVAAKLLRIIRAMLISGKSFNPKVAAIAKCSLPKQAV